MDETIGGGFDKTVVVNNIHCAKSDESFDSAATMTERATGGVTKRCVRNVNHDKGSRHLKTSY